MRVFTGYGVILSQDMYQKKYGKDSLKNIVKKIAMESKLSQEIHIVKIRKSSEYFIGCLSEINKRSYTLSAEKGAKILKQIGFDKDYTIFSFVKTPMFRVASYTEEIDFTKGIKHLLAWVNPDLFFAKNTKKWLNKSINKILRNILQFFEQRKITKKGLEKYISSEFPDELRKLAIKNATKSVEKYAKDFEDPKFSVKHIEKLLENTKKSVIIYLVAVLEYITAEITELAGNNAIDESSERVTLKHVKKALENDEDLLVLFTEKI